MDELRFVSDHNVSPCLGDPPEKHLMYKSMVDGLILSSVNYVIMEHPLIISSFINDFLNSSSERTDSNGNVSLIGKVQGQLVIIIEQIIRECLQFGDRDTDPIDLDQELIQSTVFRMGHEGFYPPTKKKLLHPYWRYLAHIVTQCLSGRKGEYNVLNQTLGSCMVAITLGLDFNYSRMIFQDMHANIKGKRYERLLAFPIFIQIIIKKRHPNLIPTVETLGIKRMKEDIFSYMTMNKKGKKQYVGARPLENFGRLSAGLDEETDEQGTPTAFVANEHDHPPAGITAEASKVVEDSSSESPSSSGQEIIREPEPVIPPLSRAERDEIQDTDYIPSPESSPKKKVAKDDVQTG
ncbi:hypothetical protein R6Q59_029520 [Mikania micrantha]